MSKLVVLDLSGGDWGSRRARCFPTRTECLQVSPVAPTWEKMGLVKEPRPNQAFAFQNSTIFSRLGATLVKPFALVKKGLPDLPEFPEGGAVEISRFGCQLEPTLLFRWG